MRRRAFITGLASAAAYPLAVRAQQGMPVIGFLRSESPEGFEIRLAAFRTGLKEIGYVEGENVTIEYRWGHSRPDALPVLAAELVRRQVAAIIVSGSPAAAMAVKTATADIPVVFVLGGDPVRQGLVASLNRPGGNVTGVSFISNSLAAKRLELLRELVPGATTIAVLVNPGSLNAEADMKETEGAARALGVRLRVFQARTAGDIDAAFASLALEPAHALFVSAEPFFTSRQEQIVALAARHAIPASYSNRDYIGPGGLMSYGTNIADAHHQLGRYTGRILKGEKPGDLPVLQPTKFELVNQPQDRQGARPRGARETAVHRRRGDRIARLSRPCRPAPPSRSAASSARPRRRRTW
jgi:putative ABC transport system substrate-binding protein